MATNTLANWVIKASDEYLSIVYDRMHELIYDNHVIHADETPVKLMRIDGKKITKGNRTRCSNHSISNQHLTNH